jgi:hypothetical protein
MPSPSRKKGSVWAGLLPDRRTLLLVRATSEKSAFKAMHDSAWSETVHALKENGTILWPYPPQFALELRPATEQEEMFWKVSWDKETDIDEADYVGYLCWPTGELPEGS